jgi:hypothetical protein
MTRARLIHASGRRIFVIVLVDCGILTSSCTTRCIRVERPGRKLGNRVIEVSRGSRARFVLEDIFQKVDGLI